MKQRDELCRAYASRRLSRRDFCTRMVQLGLSTAAVATLADTLVTPARAATPVKGGRLRIAMQITSAADTIDPNKLTSDVDIVRGKQIYDTLTEIGPDSKLKPSLATEWDSADGKKWTVTLRKGVVFHNGKSLTPADVIYSLKRVSDPKQGSPIAPYFSSLDKLSADGPDKVVIEYKEPYADFPYLLTDYHAVILPEGANNFPDDAHGTGAWKMQEFQPGVSSLMVRNNNYWRTGPYIDEVESSGIPDNGARLSALQAGEIEMAGYVEANDLQKLRTTEGIAAFVSPGAQHPTYVMRLDRPPFDNNDVRLALKSGFDRKKFLDIAFKGLGTVARDHPVAPSDPSFCENIALPTADPDKVKFHLKKAGLENHTFELILSDAMMGGVNGGVALSELMRENGVNLSVKRAPSDGYWSGVWMKEPFFGGNWFARPTPTMLLELVYRSGAAWNESAFSNAKFDQILDAAKGELNQDKRKTMLCDLQQILHDEGGSIIPVFAAFLDGVSAKVQNLQPHPLMYLGGGLWNEVWLTS
jgi:peptide/nickel transport system substrate-binding protein